MLTSSPLSRVRVALLIVLALLALAPAASAQYITLGISAGIGGADEIDGPGSVEIDPGFDNLGIQLSAAFETTPRNGFVIRLGQFDLESDIDGVGDLFDSELTYATVAGFYKFSESYYKSGLFLGVGYYDLSGERAIDDESGAGLTFGVTGDFPINQRLGVAIEFAGHATDLDTADVFITGHVGLTLRF
ncbi:MAG: hypothetical protein AAF772_14400 [Acidobacteriota bacterium]